MNSKFKFKAHTSRVSQPQSSAHQPAPPLAPSISPPTSFPSSASTPPTAEPAQLFSPAPSNLNPSYQPSPFDQPTPSHPLPNSHQTDSTGDNSDEDLLEDLVLHVPHNLEHLFPFATEWLWQDRIPMAQLTLLDGDPGSGKSLLALTIAAAVSSGQPLPGSDPLLTGTVLVVSPYDHLEAITLPRLLAAGADRSRVYHLASLSTLDPQTGILYPRPLALPQDRSLLEEHIARLQPRLVILDSLTDMLDPRSTLPVLADLNSIANTYGCAILLLRTVRTQPADLVRPRLSGPSAFKFAPAALLTVPHPHDPHQYLLLSNRHTLAPTPPLLAYTITPNNQQVPTIHWTDAPPADLLPLLAGVGARYSAQRYAILHCLQHSPTSLNAKSVAARIGFDEEPVRKMLQRMLLVGDLTSPTRGHYTTPNHPCLALSLDPSRRDGGSGDEGIGPLWAPAQQGTDPAPSRKLQVIAVPDTLSEPATGDIAQPDPSTQPAAYNADIQNSPVPNVPSTQNQLPRPVSDALTLHATPTPDQPSRPTLAPITTS